MPIGLFRNELLPSIGEKQNKSVRKERMEENFNTFDFRLTGQDLAAIATPDTKERLFFNHRDPARVKWISERKLPV